MRPDRLSDRREALTHLAVIGVAVAILAVAQAVGVLGPTTAALFIVFYALVLGGAQLYLAVQGADGMVPVKSRWRYVATIVLLAGAGILVFYGGGHAIGPITLRTVGVGIAIAIAVMYLLFESASGYEATQSE